MKKFFEKQNLFMDALLVRLQSQHFPDVAEAAAVARLAAAAYSETA